MEHMHLNDDEDLWLREPRPVTIEECFPKTLHPQVRALLIKYVMLRVRPGVSLEHLTHARHNQAEHGVAFDPAAAFYRVQPLLSTHSHFEDMRLHKAFLEELFQATLQVGGDQDQGAFLLAFADYCRYVQGLTSDITHGGMDVGRGTPLDILVKLVTKTIGEQYMIAEAKSPFQLFGPILADLSDLEYHACTLWLHHFRDSCRIVCLFLPRLTRIPHQTKRVVTSWITEGYPGLSLTADVQTGTKGRLEPTHHMRSIDSLLAVSRHQHMPPAPIEDIQRMNECIHLTFFRLPHMDQQHIDSEIQNLLDCTVGFLNRMLLKSFNWYKVRDPASGRVNQENLQLWIRTGFKGMLHDSFLVLMKGFFGFVPRHREEDTWLDRIRKDEDE